MIKLYFVIMSRFLKICLSTPFSFKIGTYKMNFIKWEQGKNRKVGLMNFFFSICVDFLGPHSSYR